LPCPEVSELRDAQQSVHLVAATVGFISFGLLWLGTILGIGLKNGWALTRIRHATIYGSHQTVTLAGLILALVHALAQLAVPGGPIRWLDEWLPFASRTKPLGTGLGVVALELMVTLALSVLVQRRLGYQRWRWVHSFGYLAFGLMVGHVLLAGSDLGRLHLRVPILAGALLVPVLWLGTLPSVQRLPRVLLGRAIRRRIGGDAVVNVDPGRCARFGFCEHEAPEVFALRSDGRLAYRSSVPPELVARALQAARACPARAIMLSRLPTSVVMPPAEPPQPHPGQPAGGPAGGPGTGAAGATPLRPVGARRSRSRR